MKANLPEGPPGGHVPIDDASAVIWSRTFVLLCIANLSFFMSSQAFLPTLPLYLLKIGGDQRDVGYVMGAYTLSAMIMRAIAGSLADRYGRKRIMITGLVVMLIVCLSYRLGGKVPFVALLRIFHGLAFGLVATAIATMAADSLPATRISEGIGYFGLASTVSMSLSPLVALWIVETFGYSALFLTVSGLVIATLMCGVLIENSQTPFHASSGGPIGKTIASLLERRSALPAAVAFFITLVNGSMLFFVALYATALHIPHIGLFFASSSVCMAFSRPLSGRWADRGGTNKIVLIGLSLMAAGVVATGLSHSLAGFLIAGALAGLGLGSCIPTLQSMAVRQAPANRRGAATGTFFAAYDMGLGFGAILWGLVVQALGYQPMFFTALIPLALAGPIYWRFRETKT